MAFRNEKSISPADLMSNKIRVAVEMTTKTAPSSIHKPVRRFISVRTFQVMLRITHVIL